MVLKLLKWAHFNLLLKLSLCDNNPISSGINKKKANGMEIFNVLMKIIIYNCKCKLFWSILILSKITINGLSRLY